MEPTWEYQLSAKKWVQYDSSINEKLNKAVESGLKTLETEIDGIDIVFDFDILKQKTVETKFLKPIRCSVLNHDKEYVLWEYLSKSRRYTSFLPVTAKELEQLHEQVDVTKVTFMGLPATVSFESQKILYGEEEQNETKIRRALSDAEPSSAGQPVLARDDTQSATRSTKRKPDVIIKPMDEEVVSKKSKLEEAFKTVKKSEELFAEVDEYCPAKDSKQVYVEKKDVYNVMLNQTNITQNNNKFFLCQLLVSKAFPPNYYVFFRWGRVGFKGQNSFTECGNDLEKAKKVFGNKFFDKTSNEFEARKKFIKVKGKYDMIEMDYSKSEEPVKEEAPEVAVDSKLHAEVQELLKLICDFKKMEAAVRGLDYDTKRAPLGKLTKAQIKAGYEALKRIEDCIIIDKYDANFELAVNDYYTRIPHYFGMRQPSPITTLEQLKHELELLEILSEIEAAVASINQKLETTDDLHPLDKTYAKLKCDLQPLPNDHERFKLVETYLHRTHTSAHNSYKMTLKNVYEVNKHGEGEKFKSELGNRRLLWHGSRITNWHGILSSGLRIAPPEAPSTGYMFGKGVYFADASSKSANYCFPSHGERGILVLSEVALGEFDVKLDADYDCHKPEKRNGKFSVKGLGSKGPNPTQFVTIDDGVIVPCGDIIDQEETKDKRNALWFNEYIVYDTNQIKLRYLVEVEFNHA
jgi:poly [ADP-ribose] polymerase